MKPTVGEEGTHADPRTPGPGRSGGDEPPADGGARALVAALRNRSGGQRVNGVPVILGIVAIAAVLTLLEPRFLSPANLTNLTLQIAAMGTIAAGLVFVLLLGEIDLSVGSVSGFAAAVVALLNVVHGFDAAVAIGLGLLVGLGIGVFHGWWVTTFRVPSLVVTLGGLLGWQGALFFVLGTRGTINITDPGITFIARDFLPAALAWLAVAAVVVSYAAAKVLGRQRRLASGVAADPPALLYLQVGLLAVGLAGAVALLNRDRGVPNALVALLALIVVLDFVSKRTRFGRYVYAVGGNAEAARRAGIPVDRIRIAVFGLGSLLAALGGIIGAARLLAVNQASGGGDLLLNAIAAVVIGGTSLFGGRGFVWSALLGALVIGMISNGMDLLGWPSSIKFIVTATVLLLAVTVDAVARRRREQAGT